MILGHNVLSGRRTQDVGISQDLSFDSMFLSANTLVGLNSSGFYKPSPIQLQGIPLGKCGFDLLLEAKSGTGKTAVFTIIALEKLDLTRGLQTLILAPTREIAAQICDVIKHIGCDYQGLNVEVVMGGIPVQEDINKLKKKDVHILVGSPGRLKHLIDEKHLDVTAVRLLVLDEADKLMEKSFLKDINFIFSTLPKQKQVVMSSATYPEDSKNFIKKYVQNAQHVCPDSTCVLLGVEQKFTVVTNNSNVVKQTQYRFNELLKILSRKQFKQCLIFCNFQTRVVELHKMLTKQKWPAEQLYGKQEQHDRLDALKTLQEYKCRILISTDLAARGIDASNVDLVINFEPPSEWATYLHRIGRAGRFGSYGTAVTIVSQGKEERNIKGILDFLKVPIQGFWSENMPPDSNSILSKPEDINTEMIHSNIDKDNNKYHNLWTLLVAPNTKSQIDNFDTLCESFQECTKSTTVESFTDLISSFESHQLDIQKDDKELPKDFKESINKAKECFHLNHSMNHVDENSLHNQLHNGNASYLENKEFTSRNGTQKRQNRTNGFGNHIEYGHKSCDIMVNSEEYEMTQALQKAGLPIAFGKPCNKTKTRHNVKNNKMQSNCASIVNCQAVWPRTRKQNINRGDKKVVDVSSESEESFEDDNSLNNRCDNSNDSSDSDEYSDYCETNLRQDFRTNFQSYNEWYNQLKLAVRHVEYVTYIEELMKLNK